MHFVQGIFKDYRLEKVYLKTIFDLQLAFN